jgi:prophage antirepressor-like protein
MSAAIVPLVFDGRDVRTVIIDGEPWFVVADVCKVLSIQNPRDVVAKNLRKDDVAKIYVSSSVFDH